VAPSFTPAVTATAAPSATPPATLSPSPLPAGGTSAGPAPAAPAAALRFKPDQLVRGGTAIVYFDLPATSATLRFGGLQYPMIHNGAGWWAMVGIGAFAEAGPAPLSVSYLPPGQTAAATLSGSITIVAKSYPVENITLSGTAAALLSPDIVLAELNQRAAVYAAYTPEKLWSGPFLAPAAGSISGIFGEGRSYNGAPVTDYHRGTDFANSEGTLVYASASGRVAFSGELKVRGNTVIIDHGGGLFTAYHHLSAINVAAGQAVAAGQPVGLMGATGLVTGPHLHWEVIVRGIEVDGQEWLRGVEIGP
jgi:murein DD-endopeptidase MepM/ murein hydrolase activator NlpD